MSTWQKSQPEHPWDLVWGQPYIDADRLANAITQLVATSGELDFRTRLLLRDSLKALENFWGKEKFVTWLTNEPAQTSLMKTLNEDLGQPGYRNIRSRLVTSINRIQLEQIFELVGHNIRHEVEITIAGSVPTLLQGFSVRPTDDIDIIDEVPQEIREQRGVLDEISAKYGLTIGHVQSHYLPKHWRDRRQFFGSFGGLNVYIADPYDIFTSKLASKQEKHRDDLRVLSAKLDKQTARERLLTDGSAFLDNAHERQTIEDNWRFLFREPLFSDNG